MATSITNRCPSEETSYSRCEMPGPPIFVWNSCAGVPTSTERLPAPWITRQAPKQDLERDHAIQARIAGAVHLAHPAGAERADDLVPADANAW